MPSSSSSSSPSSPAVVAAVAAAAAAAASFPPPASPSGLRRAAPLSSRNRGGEGTTPSFRHIGIIRSNTRAMLPRRPSHLAWPGMPGTVLFLRENRRGEEGWGKEGRKEESGLEREKRVGEGLGGWRKGGEETDCQYSGIDMHHARVAFTFTNSHHTSSPTLTNYSVVLP